MFTTIDHVHNDTTKRLTEAANSRHTPMHTPVVGSADGDMRVMVLRAYDADTRTLRFHTDARSPKCTALGEGAAAGVLFYDPAAKVQIRARGQARIESDTPAAEAAWAESTTFARRCYLAEDAPGAGADQPVSGLPDWAEGLQPSEEQVAPARANFAILLIEVDQFDWLYLSNDGHRRAQLAYEDDAGWSGRWVVP